MERMKRQTVVKKNIMLTYFANSSKSRQYNKEHRPYCPST